MKPDKSESCMKMKLCLALKRKLFWKQEALLEARGHVADFLQHQLLKS